jgi:thiol-disulfide isomerase/thioredoxin
MNELLILILILLFLIILKTYTSCSENFTTQESINEKIPLYIFLTNSCRFCKEFEKDKYESFVKELGNEYDIKKVYLENNKELFNKYNITSVPTAIVELNNRTAVADELTKESIIKAHNSLLAKDNTNHIFDDIYNNKKELKIFLSKKCPHCINYLNMVHKTLVELLKNEFNFKLIFTDNDSDNLFSKYQVQYVPKAIISHNGEDKEVKGTITYENIRKACYNSDIKDESINKKKILVFLSRRCPHCIRYDKQTHDRLSNELRDKYKLERIYDDNREGEELFNKYDVRFVPKLLIIDDNGKYKEIEGPLTRDNILKTDTMIEHIIFNNNEDEITNYDDENVDGDNVYDDDFVDEDDDIESLRLHKTKQEVYEKLENEIINKNKRDSIYKTNDDGIYKTDEEGIYKTDEEDNKKKKIIIFLSKTCPGCINYLKNIESKVRKEFSNEYIIENKFIDEDQNLFIKHNIEYVPQVMIVHENKNEKIDGDISIENIKNTIKNLETMEGFRNINKNTEGFRNSNKVELLVFLTKTCPHCVRYDNNMHMNLEKQLRNRCRIRKIYAEDDKDRLFEKYDIQYVPKGLLLSNERYVPIEGALDNETICRYLDKINN